jgi:hypothetical protein
VLLETIQDPELCSVANGRANGVQVGSQNEAHDSRMAYQEIKREACNEPALDPTDRRVGSPDRIGHSSLAESRGDARQTQLLPQLSPHS